MRTTLVTVLLSGAAVLGYLSYRAFDLVPAPIPAETAPATPDGPRILADTLPDFTLESLAGERQSIRSWPDKALVINFWATWCPPCLREIPLLKEFQTTHRQELQIVGIAVDRRDAVTAFADQMQFNYPILIGQSDAMDAAAAFGVEFVGLPFTVFVDSASRVLAVHTGELDAADLDALVAELARLASGATDVAAVRARLAGRM
jgi:thiol-disulfide isomerase/thioredoxin